MHTTHYGFYGVDAETLKSRLRNSIKHYKGNHANCFFGSRCKGESLYYESRRIRINDTVAENLLRTALEKSIIIRKAEPFFHKMSTASAELFNNTLKAFHGETILFWDKTYKIKTARAVGFWNEGCNRISLL